MNDHIPSRGSGHRVSCDLCRAKKVRCSGEYPTCSRCLTSRRQCVYSLQMPMGRPKMQRTMAKPPRSRRRGQQLSSNSSSTVRLHGELAVDTEPGTVLAESVRVDSQSTEQTGVVTPRPVGQIESAAALPSYLVDSDTSQRACTSLAHPGVYATSRSAIVDGPGSEPCACLSVLYLLLDRLRMKGEFALPDDLVLLRDSIGTAAGVLNCTQCPLRYLCVVQNATILGILCVCIAECYSKIMETIDADVRRAMDIQDTMQLRLSTVHDKGTYIGHTDPGHATSPLIIEVIPSEWRRLMRNAVKTEIFGVGNGKEKSFMQLIDGLEERQKGWHQTPPAPDCPPIYRSVCHLTDRKPTCLLIVEDAKRLINLLDFS
ncbi:hypothetical protein BDV25DRAFT_942 [Aspergillus avenaceus]|uniref:Zn(2)-C6 fungal-type domain-containing protein n=1 Tax=Aspergillus avenaceus TaxID=36643 RepID=A0A5N6U9Q0_ASPAV|nr:hypothetical protein BDV25DRAFT_942 [Aspergillus avenaceus]